MRTNERLIVAAVIICFIAGLVLPWWPLAVFAALLAALFSWWPLAILLGLVLDCIFGAPTGFLHAVPFPFTLLIVVIVVAKALSIRHLR